MAVSMTATEVQCCPPGSAPYLAAESQDAGAEITVGVVQLYVTGDASAAAAIVMVPDVWGWKGGRCRAIADHVASTLGVYVVVPKLLNTPALEGGTDGDGIPPDFNIQERMKDWIKWVQQHPWSVLKPKVDAILKHLEGKKIGMTGYCWGSLLLCHASALSPSIVCGVCPHPSIGIEQAFGGSPAALAATVQCPLLFMPAGNDPPQYLPGGDIFDAVKAKHAGTEVLPFPDMVHGWVPRGDVSDPKVKEGVEKAVAAMTDYLAKHLGVTRSRL